MTRFFPPRPLAAVTSEVRVYMDPQPTTPLRVIGGYFPTILPIDGHAITVRITRMTLAQVSEFRQRFEQRILDPHSLRLVSTRLPGEEQAKDGDRFVIADEDIRRRRLMEMTAEQRATYDRQCQEDENAAAAFYTDAISAYIQVEPGQIEEIVDGETTKDITAGADLVRLYGARKDVLKPALMAIWRENTWSPTQKNGSASGFGSQPSSAEPGDPAAPGMRPEAPAMNVGDAPSATTGTVTESSAAMSSGLTTPALV